MKNEETKWSSSDAWLMMTISWASGGSLRDLIATGDYINHSIFSYEELKEGLQKLVTVGYVEIRADKFFATTRFKRAYSRLKNKPKNLMKELDFLRDFLSKKIIRKHELEKIPSEIISKKKVAEAYKLYMEY